MHNDNSESNLLLDSLSLQLLLLTAMAADHQDHPRTTESHLFEFRCDGRHSLLPSTLDSPRHSLPDAYCSSSSSASQCTWIEAADAGATQATVNGIDYFRYWDCCGVATVAIENKIEQALDLVKNHLMFAVREEVRTLNEEIQELVWKNEQLENENHILRSHASPETLSRLHNLLSQLSTRTTFTT